MTTKTNPNLGKRVQMHPATDQWMMGDRYGEIVGYIQASGFYKVKLDKSGRIYRVSPNDCEIL
jgi:hypothetical protein